jgi:transketolase
MIEHDGPVYYRCGYKDEPPIHEGDIDFRIGRALKVCDGKDITLIGTGTITHRVLQAALLLKKEGVEARVLSMHTVKPIDRDSIVDAASDTGAIVTIEEHNVVGGLGSAVAEVLCEEGAFVSFRRVGLPDTYVHTVGSHHWMLDQFGFSPESIANVAMEVLENK